MHESCPSSLNKRSKISIFRNSHDVHSPGTALGHHQGVNFKRIVGSFDFKASTATLRVARYGHAFFPVLSLQELSCLAKCLIGWPAYHTASSPIYPTHTHARTLVTIRGVVRTRLWDRQDNTVKWIVFVSRDMQTPRSAKAVKLLMSTYNTRTIG